MLIQAHAWVGTERQGGEGRRSECKEGGQKGAGQNETHGKNEMGGRVRRLGGGVRSGDCATGCVCLRQALQAEQGCIGSGAAAYHGTAAAAEARSPAHMARGEEGA